MSSELRRLAVFCGSAPGRDPGLLEAAYDVGTGLAERGIGLVYGAGGKGLMGRVSQGALDAGGEVIGVIPRAMVEREWGRHDLTEVHVVETMHERKALMAELADAFIALPGGLGTLEEVAEILTWSQLGLHQKPCGLLNVGGYFDALLAFLDRIVEAHFMHAEHRSMVLVNTDPEALLASFETYQPPRADKTAMALKDLQNRAE